MLEEISNTSVKPLDTGQGYAKLLIVFLLFVAAQSSGAFLGKNHAKGQYRVEVAFFLTHQMTLS